MLYREIIAVCSQIHTKHINSLCGQNRECLGAFVKLQKETISFVESVCLSFRPSAWDNSAPNEQIPTKFGMSTFGKSVEKIQVSLNSNKMTPLYMNNDTHFYLISLSSS